MDALARSHEPPKLRNPVMLVGLGGWTNAGEVATGSLTYLKENLHARKFAELDSEEYYKYTSNRPTVAIEGGRIRTLTYPITEFFYWVNPEGPQDLVLVIGAEPDLRWKSFIKLLLDTAEELGVKKLFAIGGYYDSVPHTRSARPSGTSQEASLLAELKQLQVQLTSYYGPTGIITSALLEAAKRGIAAASIWGRAPHYIQVANPRVQHEVLWRIVALCRIRLDLAPLLRRGEDLIKQVDEALTDNSQLRDYVAQLEAGPESEDLPDFPTEPLHQEDVLRSVEEFFRKGPDE